jgi:hypothetical protein
MSAIKVGLIRKGVISAMRTLITGHKELQQQMIAVTQELQDSRHERAALIEQLRLSRQERHQNFQPLVENAMALLPEPPNQQRLWQQATTKVYFPNSLKNIHVIDAFVNWHADGYYLAIGTNQISSRGVVNNKKFAVEYLTLYLDKHVDPLPNGVD